MEIALNPGGGGGGAGSLIFSHLHTLQTILHFNIFWVFQKNEYFLGYEDFVDILGWGGGHHKIGLVLGSFLCILEPF